jgi:hypothetical protein
LLASGDFAKDCTIGGLGSDKSRIEDPLLALTSGKQGG